MPCFDRFDICAAYLALEWDFNVGGILTGRPSCDRRRESVGVQLHRMGYRPGAAFNGWESLSVNAREIYNKACERWHLGDGGYKACACPSCFEIAIGYGRPLCGACQDAGCEGGADCKVEREDD